MKMSPSQWPVLAPEHLQSLSHATPFVHVAAQLLSMAGKFFLSHQTDDSHTNMGWDAAHEWLVGHPLPTPDSWQLALYPASMKLLLTKTSGSIVDEVSLGGKTLEEAVEWVKHQLSACWFDVAGYRMDLHYDLPDYPPLRGAPFEMPSGQGYEVFSQVRSLGNQVMEAYAAEFEYASPVRTWPHHFDIGTYIPLRLRENREVETSLTLGLAISDTAVDGYYFYVTHWAKSGTYYMDTLPALPGAGHWGLEGGTGAVLCLSDVVKHDSAEDQMARVEEFFTAAIAASERRLGEA